MKPSMPLFYAQKSLINKAISRPHPLTFVNKFAIMVLESISLKKVVIE